MAQLITVRLTRNDGQPWGFRLQGGKDFGSPLALQKVSQTLSDISSDIKYFILDASLNTSTKR